MKQPQFANAFKEHFTNPMHILLPDQHEYEKMQPGSVVRLKNGNKQYVYADIVNFTGTFPNITIGVKSGAEHLKISNTLYIKLHHVFDIETKNIEKQMRNGSLILNSAKKHKPVFFYFKPVISAIFDQKLNTPVSVIGKYVIGLRLFGWKIF